MKQPPYTVAQVLAQLHNFAVQLKGHPPNLTGGPGYVHHEVLNILDRGISAPAKPSRKRRPLTIGD